MSIKNFGVLAFASAAVAAGHGHQHKSLHAYGTGSSAAASSSSSAAAIPTGLPACWGTCFKEAGVSSPAALCDNEEASNCIKTACATEDVAAYEAWLKKQCSSAPYPSGGNSTAVHPTGGYSSVPGGYSTSICTETSTLIYQTTTAYSTYLITHTLSPSAPGGYGSASSDVSVGPATESASAPGGYGSDAPGAPSGGPGGYGPGAPSGTPNSPVGGDDEECSEVTVTETERTTVTVTAGQGSAPSSEAPKPSSYAPEAASSPAEPSHPAPAPTSYAPSTTEGSGEAPSSYVSEAGEAPSSWAAPSSYGAPSSHAAPSSYAPASSSSAPSSSPSSPSSGTPNGWKGKRGLCYNYTSDVVDALFEGTHIGWATNWDSEDYSKLPADFPFIPTLHSNESYWTEKFASDVETALSNGAEYIFGQNEPDMTSQANQTPEQAAQTWRDHVEPFAGKAKLCAPSVTNSPAGSGMGLEWLDQFMEHCSDCTIDCVNAHWYDSRGNDVEIFKEQVGAASKYGLPVFVGEFAGVGSSEEISEFLGEVMPWMDSNDDIVGYAYFMVYNGLLVDGTSTSSYGETYCNGN